jgi:hypothetical protein
MYLSRLVVSLLLGCTLWFIGWGTLTWYAKAQKPADCIAKPILSKNDTPSYLFDPYHPLVYTLTNGANCTDTFSIKATTLSGYLFVEWWDPITIEIASNQDIPITIHIPIITDIGNITDTIIITASSQTDDTVKAVLVDPVVVLGSVYPSRYSVYLPLVIKTP